MIPVKFKKYPIDLTGKHPDNFIANERHEIRPDRSIIVPEQGYFYETSLVVRSAGRVLTAGVDYRADDLHPDYTAKTGQSVMTTIIFNPNIVGDITIDYQCYGHADDFTPELAKTLIQEIHQSLNVGWKQVGGKPALFPPEYHRHFIGSDSIYGWDGLLNSLREYAHALLLMLNRWSYEENRLYFNHFADMQAKYDFDYQNAISDINQLKDKIAQLLNLKSSTNEALGRINNRIDHYRDVTTRQDKTIADALANLRTNISDFNNQQRDSLRRELDALIQQVNASLANINSFETKVGAQQKADNAKQTAITESNQYTDELIETLRRALTQGDTTTLESAKTYAKSYADAIDRALSNTITGLERIVANNDRSRTEKDTEIMNLINSTKQELTRKIEDLLTGLKKTNTSDTKTNVVNKFVFVDSNGITPVSNIIEFRDPKTQITVTDGWYRGTAKNTKIDATGRGAIWSTRFNAYEMMAERQLWHNPSSNLIANTYARELSPSTSTIYFGKEEMEYSRGVISNSVPVHAPDFIFSNEFSVKNTTRANAIAIRGNRSLVKTLNYLLNNIVSLQPSTNDYPVGSVPVFFSNGLIDVGKLSIANKMTLSARGDFILASHAMKSPDFTLTSSDKRLKEDIRPVKNALAKINQIHGYHYQMKSTKRHTTGVIAQEVERVMPELVSTDPSSGYKSVAYSGLIPYLIDAIHELTAEKEALEARLSILEHKVSML